MGWHCHLESPAENNLWRRQLKSPLLVIFGVASPNLAMPPQTRLSLPFL